MTATGEWIDAVVGPNGTAIASADSTSGTSGSVSIASGVALAGASGSLSVTSGASSGGHGGAGSGR